MFFISYKSARTSRVRRDTANGACADRCRSRRTCSTNSLQNTLATPMPSRRRASDAATCRVRMTRQSAESAPGGRGRRLLDGRWSVGGTRNDIASLNIIRRHAVLLTVCHGTRGGRRHDGDGDDGCGGSHRLRPTTIVPLIFRRPRRW